jgi:hypothetical protein
MKRTLYGIALFVGIAAILAPAAQAKPTAAKQQQPPVEVSVVSLGPGEIPYVSHAKLRMGTGEVPYLDDGASPATITHEPAASIGDGADVAYGVVSGAAIALLLAFGLAFVAVRQTRKTRLSPA